MHSFIHLCHVTVQSCINPYQSLESVQKFLEVEVKVLRRHIPFSPVPVESLGDRWSTIVSTPQRSLFPRESIDHPQWTLMTTRSFNWIPQWCLPSLNSIRKSCIISIRKKIISCISYSCISYSCISFGYLFCRFFRWNCKCPRKDQIEGLVLRRQNCPLFYKHKLCTCMDPNNWWFLQSRFLPQRNSSLFQKDSNVSKIIQPGIPSEFSTRFSYEVSPAKLISLPSESPSERITTTLVLVFSKISFRQEPSQQFLLAANSAFCSLSCSQKITSNFWCVYFPSKLSTTQQ